MTIRMRAVASAFLIVLWELLMPAPVIADEPIPGNLVSNFSFEQGFRFYSPYPDEPGEVANGWMPFTLSGRPTFRDTAAMSPSFVEKIHGADSQTIWSWGNPFVAGIYQQVGGTVPGHAYIAWYATSGAYLCNDVPCGPPGLERTIGIDPYGATDPASPQVLWGSRYALGPWATIEQGNAPTVPFIARNTSVTLFVKVSSTATYPQAYQAYIDAVALVETAVPSEMRLDVSSATFLATPQGSYFPQVMSIGVNGTGSFTWTATVSSENWLKAIQASGTRGEALRLVVENMPPELGIYHAQARIVASEGTSNGEQTVPVDLLVTPQIWHGFLPLVQWAWASG